MGNGQSRTNAGRATYQHEEKQQTAGAGRHNKVLTTKTADETAGQMLEAGCLTDRGGFFFAIDTLSASSCALRVSGSVKMRFGAFLFVCSSVCMETLRVFIL